MKRTLSFLTLGLAALILTASLAAAETDTATKATGSAPAAAAAKAPATQASPATPAASKSHMAATHAPAMDINTASKEDLMKLPGVGDAIADKIIAGRPYTSKAQLLSKNVVNKATYSKIRGMVVAKAAAK